MGFGSNDLSGKVRSDTVPAARLVRFAGVNAGAKLLDVGCGTGGVAVTTARLGANVQAIDLTPELLERARENSRIAGVQVSLREGDGADWVYSGHSHCLSRETVYSTRGIAAVKRFLSGSRTNSARGRSAAMGSARLGNKEIGEQIGTAAGTEAHIENILGKLEAKDRTHAVTISVQRGIIHMTARNPA